MTIAIAILSIGILVVLHELGHFLVAKKFNVKIEEFGIGLPPRLFGKKYGETIYSINALPIGGFVRMEGEEKRSDGPRSFNRKPLWQRFLIVGIFSFCHIFRFLLFIDFRLFQ
ncbi:site-2 protease family protein [Patescibacteria group bacterium]|nr:site-2 protease family protein [Patescibacteria group bacterium]